MTKHRYLAFGLRIESAWPIASLIVSKHPFPSGPDVDIVEGQISVPEEVQRVEGIDVGVEGRNAYLAIEECGRFQVIDGRTIIVEPDPSATREQVNLYLLGSVFGTLLHQRRILPFHCNAVELEGSAFLFCGDSGAGKSTLAAYFIDRGLRLLGDDLCALHFDCNGQLMADPGAARLKLWKDTLEAFGRTSVGLELVPWYDDKFEIPLASERPVGPLPVAGLYHLRTAENGRDPGIRRVKGLEAANSVTANIYRRRLADLVGAAPFYLDATKRILDQLPIFTINRNWGYTHFRKEALAAERHMRRLVRETTAIKCNGTEPTYLPEVEQ